MSGNPEYKFHGVYQGTVFSNIDSEQRGRLMVQVPDVLGDEPCIWAEAASPVAGHGMGFYAVPSLGSQVWVSFVDGNPQDALWIGALHETMSDQPAEVITNTDPLTPPAMLFSQEGHSIAMIDGLQLDASPGGIFLKHALGHSVEITETHIKLAFGLPGGLQSTIVLDATGVSINGTALTVSNLGV